MDEAVLSLIHTLPQAALPLPITLAVQLMAHSCSG